MPGKTLPPTIITLNPDDTTTFDTTADTTDLYLNVRVNDPLGVQVVAMGADILPVTVSNSSYNSARTSAEIWGSKAGTGRWKQISATTDFPA